MSLSPSVSCLCMAVSESWRGNRSCSQMLWVASLRTSPGSLLCSSCPKHDDPVSVCTGINGDCFVKCSHFIPSTAHFFGEGDKQVFLQMDFFFLYSLLCIHQNFSHHKTLLPFMTLLESLFGSVFPKLVESTVCSLGASACSKWFIFQWEGKRSHSYMRGCKFRGCPLTGIGHLWQHAEVLRTVELSFQVKSWGSGQWMTNTQWQGP